MDRYFRDTLNEALDAFAKRGYVDPGELDYWMASLREAAEQSLTSTNVLQEKLRRSLRSRYRRALRSGFSRSHPRLKRGTIKQIEPELRQQLEKRILASANLIRLHREENINKILQRFSGWATSVPEMPGKQARKSEVRESIRKSFRQMSFEERRLSIDQGHKLVSSINRTIADQYGAVAAKWRHVHEANYDARPEHEARDGVVYLLRDTWATQKGLVKPGGKPYLDDIDQPAEKPYCRCWAEYIYDLGELPDDMLTRKGKEIV